MTDSTPGLYVHIPFCLSRCSYCAFVSTIYDENIADSYIDALGRELSLHGIFSSACRPSTLFIGGGTPSSLTTAQLRTLLEVLPFPAGGGEATCELNPDSANDDKLRLLADFGVNRCSFGVQTFSERGLRLLGRRHDADTAEKAVAAAVKMGFRSVSIDLITAWPGQTVEELRSDMARAVDLGITHISCYNLMVEEESSFYNILVNNELSEKSDDEYRVFWDCADEVLAMAGFAHYETSNFCRPGFACRHNVDTWKGCDYVGIGLAAHSHLGGKRFANGGDMGDYVERVKHGRMPAVFSEELPPEDKAKECAVFWLRLFEGVDVEEFSRRTGYGFFDLYRGIAEDLLGRGLLEQSPDGKKVFVPKKYQPVLDSILIELV